jgi:4-oxalocrotonate tautomerase
MPLINVKLIEGVFSPEQKREIIQRLTETMVEIEGENLRQVTWVVVDEVKSGDWGIGALPAWMWVGRADEAAGVGGG